MLPKIKNVYFPGYDRAIRRTLRLSKLGVKIIKLFFFIPYAEAKWAKVLVTDKTL
jgi:hypothetical protein